MGRFTLFIMIILTQFLLIDAHQDSGVVHWNAKTCQATLDPSTYDVKDLKCTYMGGTIYEFAGPSKIEILTLDRLPADVALIVDKTMQSLEKIVINDGASCQNILCNHDYI